MDGGDERSRVARAQPEHRWQRATAQSLRSIRGSVPAGASDIWRPTVSNRRPVPNADTGRRVPSPLAVGATGMFLEAFRRSGLTSVGGHAFIGDERRRLLSAVVTHVPGSRFALLAGVGAFHATGVTDTRFSIGGEATISSRVVGGIRVDHRTGLGRDPAVLLYGNGHVPFGPSSFRQALRVRAGGAEESEYKAEADGERPERSGPRR